jgi:hypothetical protein
MNDKSLKVAVKGCK